MTCFSDPFLPSTLYCVPHLFSFLAQVNIFRNKLDSSCAHLTAWPAWQWLLLVFTCSFGRRSTRKHLQSPLDEKKIRGRSTLKDQATKNPCCPKPICECIYVGIFCKIFDKPKIKAFVLVTKSMCSRSCNRILIDISCPLVWINQSSCKSIWDVVIDYS